MQGEALTEPEATALQGLTNPRSIGLERSPIRAREASVTLAAWRLTVASDEGQGTITLVEVSPADVAYRGDGIFLGWPQERLAAAYQALAPKDEAPAPETQQLG